MAVFIGVSKAYGGILVSGGSHRIIGNVIAKNGTGPMFQEFGGGLFISLTDGAVVANNTFYKNRADTGDGSMSIGGGAGFYVAASNVNLLLANNIVQENLGEGGRCEAGAGVTLQTNNFYGNPDGDNIGCPAGAGDLSVDAAMVDPAAGDYRLTDGSPLVDMGTPGISGTPGDDVYQEPRVADGDGNGSAIVDMGADEVNPPPPPAWVAAEAEAGTGEAGAPGASRLSGLLCFLLLPLGFVLFWKTVRQRSL